MRLWIRSWPSCSTADAAVARHLAIKHRLGKLAVTPAAFRDQSLAAGAALLPVLDAHVIETAQLPLVHHDPFDRLLIAQARVEGLMAVSADGHWPGYDVSLHRVR